MTARAIRTGQMQQSLGSYTGIITNEDRKIAFKQAPEANYHLSYLPRLAPWLFSYMKHANGDGKFEFATKMRPLFAASIAEIW